ncbi:MAG TPA: type IV secretion system DNA-binding domain-containing protein [Candidatus Paceibacterota bacterium]|nr:type IV secretion system DNA-binding domain-containing protein [Candidatus Paceibacterota bacterium]
MSPIFLVIYAAVLVILVVTALIILGAARSRGNIARSLRMVLFLFALPRYATTQGQQARPDKELIAVMEQVYSAVANLHAKGWNRFMYGDPYIAMEMSVHHVGEQVHFYVAVPAPFADPFERQVQGLFPTAQIERSPDYSIFNPQGASAGAWLKLKAEPILPIRSYSQLESDPLGPLVAALGRLAKEGEGATIQITVRPSSDSRLRKLAMETAHYMQAGNPFAKAIKLAKNPPKKEKEESEKGVVKTPEVATEFENQVIRALQSKAARPLFDCNVRILTAGGDQTRADQILDDVIGAFSQFGSPDLNSFKAVKLKGKALERLVFEYAFRLFNHGQSVKLSSEEVTSLYHFPVSSLILPKVKFAGFKTAEPPPGIPQEGIEIAVNRYQGRETSLRLAREDRRRHMYIIGQTGTGKSTTMNRMIYDDLRAGEGLSVIDPHGSLAEQVLSYVPKERADDVIYFNPSDVAHPMGLNMLEFDPASPQDKTLIIDELFEIMDKLYDLKETGGPQFERYFKNAMFLLLDNFHRRVPTLADMSRVFIDEAFRNDLLANETNQIVRQFWELEATKTTGDQSLANFAGYITSKIDAFTSNDFLRPIINQTRSVIDFRDVIENRKILVVNLSKGKIGDLNGNLLGMVIIGKLRRAALARDTTKDLADHYVYMDEFQNFTTNSISVILAEARKYRLCLVMAHQFIKQLDEKIAAAVFGNVGTTMVFRISPEDAENPVIKTKFDPVFSPADVANIDNFNAYIAMLVNGSVARPTNGFVSTDIYAKGKPEMREVLTEMSRLKFGRPRDEIEAEIQQRFGITAA